MKRYTILISIVAFGTLAFYNHTKAINSFSTIWENTKNNTCYWFNTGDGVNASLIECTEKNYAYGNNKANYFSVPFYVNDGTILQNVSFEMHINTYPISSIQFQAHVKIQFCNANESSCTDKTTDSGIWVTTGGYHTIELPSPYTMALNGSGYDHARVLWEFDTPSQLGDLQIYSASDSSIYTQIGGYGSEGFNIIYPSSNATEYGSNAITYGKCETTVSAEFRNAATEASSTASYFGSATCDNLKDWYFDYNINPGQWWVVASSTQGASTITYTRPFYLESMETYYRRQRQYTATGTQVNPEIKPNCNYKSGWSCDSWFGDVCASAGLVVESFTNSTCDLITTSYEKLKKVKPYEYVFQIKDSFDTMSSVATGASFAKGLFNADYSGQLLSELQSATSTGTSTVRFAVNAFGHNIELFNSSSTFSQWNTVWTKLRPYEDLIIYMGFATYLIFRFVL